MRVSPHTAQAIRDKLPPLYGAEDQGLQAKALVKFFTADGNWTWFATEFDQEDILFGLAVGFEAELGYFSLSEILEVRGALDLPVERDLYFQPRTLEDLLKEYRSR